MGVLKSQMSAFEKYLKEYNEEQCDECEEEDDLDFSSLFSLFPNMNQQRDTLAENGVVFLNGTINQKTADQTIRRLWAYHFEEEFVDPINLIINSPGGYSHSGWALIDTIAAIKNPVHTVAMGDISSMATLIFITGDVRKMSGNAVAMIHNFSTVAWGNYPELLAERKSWELEYKRGMEHLIRHSKYNTEKEIREYLLKDQDNWLSPKEMKKHELTDRIFKSPERKKKKK
jgi:ATP-dependent protease ClpP protease subunit